MKCLACAQTGQSREAAKWRRGNCEAHFMAHHRMIKANEATDEGLVEAGLWLASNRHVRGSYRAFVAKKMAKRRKVAKVKR